MSFVNRQLRLKSRPEGLVRQDNFELHEQATAELAEGQALVRVLYLSMDPTNRVWMSDIPQYMPPVALGAPMRGLICGTVVKSASDSVAEGAIVMGVGTWSDYACVPAAMVSTVPEIKGMPRSRGSTLRAARSRLGPCVFHQSAQAPRHWCRSSSPPPPRKTLGPSSPPMRPRTSSAR